MTGPRGATFKRKTISPGEKLSNKRTNKGMPTKNEVVKFLQMAQHTLDTSNIDSVLNPQIGRAATQFARPTTLGAGSHVTPGTAPASPAPASLVSGAKAGPQTTDRVAPYGQQPVQTTFTNPFSTKASDIINAFHVALDDEGIRNKLSCLFDRPRAQISANTQQISELQAEVARLDLELDELRQYSRRNALRIIYPPWGPENDKEDTDQMVLTLCRDVLEVNLEPGDISRSHRVGRYQRGGPPRPILVKFKGYREREKVYEARKKMPEQAYINEDLTINTAKLAYAARQAKKQHSISDTWVRDGRVYIRCHIGKPKVVRTEDDIHRAISEAGPSYAEISLTRPMAERSQPTLTEPRRGPAPSIPKFDINLLSILNPDLVAPFGPASMGPMANLRPPHPPSMGPEIQLPMTGTSLMNQNVNHPDSHPSTSVKTHSNDPQHSATLPKDAAQTDSQNQRSRKSEPRKSRPPAKKPKANSKKSRSESRSRKSTELEEITLKEPEENPNQELPIMDTANGTSPPEETPDGATGDTRETEGLGVTLDGDAD